MPITSKISGETAARIATVIVIVSLSWFAAVKEKHRSRWADRESYVIGLRTDLSCLTLSGTAGVRSEWCLDDRLSTENRRWNDRRVTFATLDAGEVCKTGGDLVPDLDSRAAREETAIEWMRETFAEAELQGSEAIVFLFLEDVSESHTELWLSLREELARFRNPVIDIHRNPSPDRADERLHTTHGGPFANLISVVTGAGEVGGREPAQWLTVGVDTRSAGLLSTR